MLAECIEPPALGMSASVCAELPARQTMPTRFLVSPEMHKGIDMNSAGTQPTQDIENAIMYASGSERILPFGIRLLPAQPMPAISSNLGGNFLIGWNVTEDVYPSPAEVGSFRPQMLEDR